MTTGKENTGADPALTTAAGSLVFNPCGEDIQAILRRGYLLAQMLPDRRLMSEEEKEAVDYFKVASYSPENPPAGFTPEQWAIVEKMGDSKENVKDYRGVSAANGVDSSDWI
jgi:hypothetical protein